MLPSLLVQNFCVKCRRERSSSPQKFWWQDPTQRAYQSQLPSDPKQASPPHLQLASPSTKPPRPEISVISARASSSPLRASTGTSSGLRQSRGHTLPAPSDKQSQQIRRSLDSSAQPEASPAAAHKPSMTHIHRPAADHAQGVRSRHSKPFAHDDSSSTAAAVTTIPQLAASLTPQQNVPSGGPGQAGTLLSASYSSVKPIADAGPYDELTQNTLRDANEAESWAGVPASQLDQELPEHQGHTAGVPHGQVPDENDLAGSQAGAKAARGAVSSKKQAALQRLAGKHPQLFRALQAMQLDQNGRISSQSIAQVGRHCASRDAPDDAQVFMFCQQPGPPPCRISI